MTERQHELLQAISAAKEAGYPNEKKAEQKTIDALVNKKLVKKGPRTSKAVTPAIASQRGAELPGLDVRRHLSLGAAPVRSPDRSRPCPSHEGRGAAIVTRHEVVPRNCDTKYCRRLFLCHLVAVRLASASSAPKDAAGSDMRTKSHFKTAPAPLSQQMLIEWFSASCENQREVS